MPSDEIIPGDIVSVQFNGGSREGIVVGSQVDWAGRQMLQVRIDSEPDVYHAWYPTVTRVKRTISYTRPPPQQRSVERYIYW